MHINMDKPSVITTIVLAGVAVLLSLIILIIRRTTDNVKMFISTILFALLIITAQTMAWRDIQYKIQQAEQYEDCHEYDKAYDIYMELENRLGENWGDIHERVIRTKVNECPNTN